MAAPESITLRDCSIETMSNITFVHHERVAASKAAAAAAARAAAAEEEEAPFRAAALRRRYARLRRLAVVAGVVIALLCVTNFYFIVRSWTKSSSSSPSSSWRRDAAETAALNEKRRSDAAAWKDMNATELERFVDYHANKKKKDDGGGGSGDSAVNAVDLQLARRLLASMSKMFDGFQRRLVSCRLRDECAWAPCHAHAVCVDTLCSFACECDRGFRGNGTHCEKCRSEEEEEGGGGGEKGNVCDDDGHDGEKDDKKDEDADVVAPVAAPAPKDDPCSAFPCGANATCDAASGAAWCVCHPGFKKRNGACVDNDECLLPSACHASARCVNEVGGFRCVCDDAAGAPPLFPDPVTGVCRPAGFDCLPASPDPAACYLFGGATDDAAERRLLEAHEFCYHRGAGLAAVETQSENDFLQAEIRRRGGDGSDWALGATDEHREGAWAWIRRTGMEEVKFTDWMEGQPDNGGGGGEVENYMQMKGGTGDLKWNDVGDEKMNFICEYLWKAIK